MWASQGCLLRSRAARIRPYNSGLRNAARYSLNGIPIPREIDNQGKTVKIVPGAKVQVIPPQDRLGKGTQREEMSNSNHLSSLHSTKTVYRPHFLDRPTRKIAKSWTPVAAVWKREDVNVSEVEQLKSNLLEQTTLIDQLEKELKAMQMDKSKPLTGVKTADKNSKKINASKDENDQSSLQNLKDDLRVTLVDPDALGRQATFDDVVGHEETKQALLEAIIWPASAHPSLFTSIRARSNGVLLYGPPGCGKTMLARAAAVELKGITSFFLVRPGDIMARFYGESQQRVQALEELVRESAPAIVFFDEVDSLLGNRDGSQVADYHRATTNALLAWMDGFSGGDERIFFMAATNRPGSIDEAALRRFDEVVEVGTPSSEMLVQLLTKLIEAARNQGHLIDLEACQIESIAEEMDGLSLADVDQVVRKSFFHVLRELPTGVTRYTTPADVPPVTAKHFQKILKGFQGTKELHKQLQRRDAQ